MKSTGKQRLDQAAQEVGATLGHLSARLDKWRKQRDEIAVEVRKAVEVGHKMLAELGALGAPVGRMGQLPKNRGGRRPGFKMSEEAKAKIAAAARKRWALRKKGR